MKNKFTATSSIVINAPATKVWDALTNPALIKQYLFGTEATSEWKEGSSITYKGEWDGKAYEDKGTILKIVPEEILVTTYFSNVSGLEDVPENYNTVSYILTSEGEGTKLTITQDNIVSEESAKHSENNWSGVLKMMKGLLEK